MAAGQPEVEFSSMIHLLGVSKIYGTGETAVRALDTVTLDIAEKEFVAITGSSGSGKSTMLHLLGALDTPTSGEIHVAGVPLHSADEARLTSFRRTNLGMVFQFFHLLPTMNALENVALPLMLQGARPDDATDSAREMLALVGLSARADKFGHQLSGGEMQRVAVARALVHRPALLLADEPTGNLDSSNACAVLDLLVEISKLRLSTIVVVTHSEEVAAVASRRIRMEDGRVVA